MAALNKFGKNWKKVEAYVGTRVAEQIRSHAQKYFMKLKRKRCSKTAKVNLPKDNHTVTAHPKEADPILIKLKELEARSKDLNDRVERPEDQSSKLGLQQELITVSQEAFKVKAENKYNPEIGQRCVNVIRNTNKGILELAAYLKKLTTNCPFLIQRMQPFGFNALSQINDQYFKLSDWVDTVFRNRSAMSKKSSSPI